MLHFLAHWLGIDNAAGRIYLSWSGFIGSSIFGAIGAILRRTLRLHHQAQMAQDASHHAELMAQDAKHHEALKEHLTGLLGNSSGAPEEMTVHVTGGLDPAEFGRQVHDSLVDFKRRDGGTP